MTGSTHTYRVDDNYKEPSIDLETNTKSNKDLEKTKHQQNKNVTQKSDSDNINEKNKKREYLLTKKVRHEFLVKARPSSGAKVSCVADHLLLNYQCR